MAGILDAVASKVVEAIQLQQSQPTPDPLANLKAIEEAYKQGWQLSTGQLAPLLGLK